MLAKHMPLEVIDWFYQRPVLFILIIRPILVYSVFISGEAFVDKLTVTSTRTSFELKLIGRIADVPCNPGFRS
jgi:hypothetical protein